LVYHPRPAYAISAASDRESITRPNFMAKFLSVAACITTRSTAFALDSMAVKRAWGSSCCSFGAQSTPLEAANAIGDADQAHLEESGIEVLTAR
jgi:hypothetical protein